MKLGTIVVKVTAAANEPKTNIGNSGTLSEKIATTGSFSFGGPELVR